MKFTLRFLFVIFLLIAGFAAGYFLRPQINLSKQKIVNAPNEEFRQGNYKFINPLLYCDLGQDSFGELHPFKSAIENVIEKEKTNGNIKEAAVYFRDLNNGPWFGINESVDFQPASLLKVPVMIAFFKQAASNPDFAKQVVVISSKAENFNNVSQLIPPAVRLQFGQSYTVRQLVEQMIVYSDNQALSELSQIIDPQILQQVYQDFNIPIQKEGRTDALVSVRRFSSFLRILFNASYLTRTDSEDALEILSKSNFKDGLGAGLPQNILLANKFGEREDANSKLDQLHDCGIVYFPKHPYLLCVMTKGTDLKKQASSIATISRTVYNEVDKDF